MNPWKLNQLSMTTATRCLEQIDLPKFEIMHEIYGLMHSMLDSSAAVAGQCTSQIL